LERVPKTIKRMGRKIKREREFARSKDKIGRKREANLEKI